MKVLWRVQILLEEISYNLQSGDYNIVLGQKANCNRTSK